MTARIPVARADLQVGDVVTWRRIRDGELVERTEEVVARGGYPTDDYLRTETSGYFRRYPNSSHLEVVSAYRPAPEPEVTVTPRSYGVRVDGRYVGTVYSEAVADRFEAVPDAGAGRDTYHATLDEAVAALVAAWEARS